MPLTTFIEIVLAERGVRPSAEDIKSALDRALYQASETNGQAPITPPNSRAYGCAQRGCIRKAYAGGWCNAHYLRNRDGKRMDLPVRSVRSGYACVECGDPQGTKGGFGRCSRHLKRYRQRALKLAALVAFGNKCWGCGDSFPLAVFDFHHLGAKTDSPSAMFANASTQRIADELSHCVPLCANCHRLEHSHA